ncbi:MAG: hypothetical protein HPY62_06680 [Bacteroidales bacterium]|nr:hypothetical protein [Bacteroidales bacterium]
MKKTLLFLTVVLTFTILFTACKKDKGDPPALPPAESMLIDFNNFDAGTKSETPEIFPKGTEISNWEFAAGVALIWKTIVYTTLAVPVKSFQLAVNKTPTYIEDNTWEWKYDATITIDQLSVTYKARLTGQIRSNDVLWKMYISKEGTNPFSEFVWFEGTSKLDGTGGQWVLKQGPQNQVPILQIDWTKTGESVGMVKYTYVKTGDSLKDSYIEFGLKTGSLNAYYEVKYYHPIYQDVFEVDVEWSTTGHNGRVRCEKFFGNTDWYCWDINHINVSC